MPKTNITKKGIGKKIILEKNGKTEIKYSKQT